MPFFQYRSITSDSTTHRGRLQATDRASAARSLQDNGHVLLELSVSDRVSSLLDFLARDVGRHRTVPPGKTADIIGRLATLLEANFTVEAALGILGASHAKGRVKQVIGEVLDRLRAGASLSNAMAVEGGVFSRAVIAMVRAGEAGGTLALTLRQLGTHLARQEAVRQSVRSALIYPALLLITAAGSILLVLTVVLPELEPVITEAGVTPPQLARLAFLASSLLRQYWLPGLIALLAAGLLARHAMTDPALKTRRDALVLKVPVLGPALRCSDTGRFARTLGGLVGGGVSLPAALSLAQPVIANRSIASAVAKVASGVREGGGLSGPLNGTRALSDLAIQMIQIGEATGRLGLTLLQLAEICEEDTKRVLDRSLVLMVPIITVLLGILVAAIIGSVMTAVLSMNDLVR